MRSRSGGMRRVALPALCMAFLFTSSAPAQNLVQNFSWETGDISGWTECGYIFMDPTLWVGAHHGDHYCGPDGCCGTWPAGGVHQTVSLDPGVSYDVEGWVKGCDNGVSMFGIGFADCESPPATTLVTNTTCSWTGGSTTVTGLTSIEVVYHSPQQYTWASAAAHFDDTYVVPVVSVDEWALY